MICHGRNYVTNSNSLVHKSGEFSFCTNSCAPALLYHVCEHEVPTHSLMGTHTHTLVETKAQAAVTDKVRGERKQYSYGAAFLFLLSSL